MTIQRFRILAVVEAISWLALIGAVIAKRAFGVEGTTSILGPIHGVIFLAYFAAVFLVRDDLGWDLRRTLVAIAAAIIPLGAYIIVERHFLDDGSLGQPEGRGAR